MYPCNECLHENPNRNRNNIQEIACFHPDGVPKDSWPQNPGTKGLKGCSRYEPKSETVNHPSHYNSGKIEVIDAIEDWKLNFHAGNVIKYVARYEHKNGLEDLRKARWYLSRLIEIMSKEND